MPRDDHGWLLRDSPSLLLLMDDKLDCHHMASVWRARLPRALAERTVIPASDLFDFANEPDLQEQFRLLAQEGTPIVNQAVGLFLEDGLLPCATR